MKRALLGIALATAAAGGSCGVFFPLGLDSLGDTRIRAACHFAFACCTPTERDLLLNVGDFRDEGTCVSEAEQDKGSGAIFQIDQDARDAVARGTATYDGDAATKCSQQFLDAVNQCKADALFDGDGRPDLAKIEGLLDTSDPECVALGLRDFTRGTVKDGDDCVSSFDCADFGICVTDPADAGKKLTVKGTCKAPHQEGEDCSDGGDCAPGTTCTPPAQGGAAPTCVKPVPKADGKECSVDADCQSGNCATTVQNGTCFNDPAQACTQDADCAANDFCDGQFTVACAPKKQLKIEVCDGT